MKLRTAFTLPLVLAFLSSPLAAEDLGGGLKASNGLRPVLQLDSWIPGQPSAFRFSNMPQPAVIGLIIMSDRVNRIPISGVGTLVPDVTSPAFVILPVPASTPIPIPMIMQSLAGLDVIMQGGYLDKGWLQLTDATRVSFFDPIATVGCQRQNTYHVIDIGKTSVKQVLTGTNNGSLLFTPDGTRAYSNEHGSGKSDHVKVYDVTVNPIRLLTTIPISGGIRYQSAMPKDGKRLYVPVHDHIGVIDTDPKSKTYHQVIQKLVTQIKGVAAGIGAGPLALAVTPDGSKLYIGYGQSLSYPNKGTVGMFLTKVPNFKEVSIPVTTGGTFLGTSSRNKVAMSPDGRHLVTLEWGIPTGLAQFYKGFTNGALLNVIDTSSDKEVATIATQGFDQGELSFDRVGRRLWVATRSATDTGRLLRIDIDKDSVAKWTPTWFNIVNTPFTSGGLFGVDVTPDGSRVLMCVAEDNTHQPTALVFDTLTSKQVGSSIAVGTLPRTVSIQKK